MNRPRLTPRVRPLPPPVEYEVEVLPGLEEFVEQEIRHAYGDAVNLLGRSREGRVSIRFRGDPRRLDNLRTAVAVHRVETFVVPRPKALLGHEHLTRLRGAIQQVVDLRPPGAFAGLRLSAAGADSPVLTRLRGEIEAVLGRTEAPDSGTLLVSLRRGADATPTWQVLVRLTPRPLTARQWRVCNLPGALDASVASVMARLPGLDRSQRVLNLACGSGTLLIERLRLVGRSLAVGVDLSPRALDCARENLAAADLVDEVRLVRADATQLPIRSATFDVLLADLPYGMLVGAPKAIAQLYPALLGEAARVADPNAVFVAITASKRAFASALEQHAHLWQPTRTITVKVPFQRGYITPTISVLRRTRE